MKLVAFTIFLLIVIDVTMAIGVGPSSLTFEKVLRAGYSEQTLYIMNTEDNPIEVKIEKEGEIIEWLGFFSYENDSLNPDSFIVGPRSTFNLQVNVTPPLDVQVKSYTARLIVS